MQLNEDGSGTALYDNRYDTETQSYRLDFPLDLNATVGGSGRIDLLSKYEVGLVPQDTQGSRCNLTKSTKQRMIKEKETLR